MMLKDVDITGNLVKIASNGLYGIAQLNEPLDGLRLVVINDATKGRISLMKRLGGRLIKGGEVRFRQLQKQREAFVAMQVE